MTTPDTSFYPRRSETEPSKITPWTRDDALSVPFRKNLEVRALGEEETTEANKIAPSTCAFARSSPWFIGLL
jgi:hypothetical protein